MKKLLKEKHFCNNISTYDYNFMLQKGRGWKSKILFVGESPSSGGWIVSGKAFYNTENKLVPSGIKINKLFEKFNLKIEDCSFTELCKCFVNGNREKIKSCCSKCWPLFLKQLNIIKPKIIIILGKKTLDIFNENNRSNFEMGIFSDWCIKNHKVFILPIFHPSPINPRSYKLNENILNNCFLGLKKQLKLLYEK